MAISGSHCLFAAIGTNRLAVDSVGRRYMYILCWTGRPAGNSRGAVTHAVLLVSRVSNVYHVHGSHNYLLTEDNSFVHDKKPSINRTL